MIYKLARAGLFQLDPEAAHSVTMGMLARMRRLGLTAVVPGWAGHADDIGTPVDAFGLHFANGVGLAAGFDKDARYLHELAALGFGHVEIGTVTPKPQAGNELPRLFRLPKDGALINRMGFNNLGVDVAALRLQTRPDGLIVGGNIGKNKNTPNEDAPLDYAYCTRALRDVVDYFTVNVSSPNTPGLRALQEREPLLRILDAVQGENQRLSKPRPVLLKLAPDLGDEALQEAVEVAVESGLAGLVATNTTISRAGLATSPGDVANMGAGGLSGKPLRSRATEVVRLLYQAANGRLQIIAAGGIYDAASAVEKLDAGAVLLQVYTSFVYEGPAIVGTLAKAHATWAMQRSA